MDLTEAEGTKKRWQEYTDELYKKHLNDQTTTVVWWLTYRQTSWSVKSSGVKWALGSLITDKASGGDVITAELAQILKDDAVEVWHSICQHIWKTQEWPQNWKRLVLIPIPKKGNANEWSNYHTIKLISHASKVVLKILQARFQ